MAKWLEGTEPHDDLGFPIINVGYAIYFLEERSPGAALIEVQQAVADLRGYLKNRTTIQISNYFISNYDSGTLLLDALEDLIKARRSGIDQFYRDAERRLTLVGKRLYREHRS